MGFLRWRFLLILLPLAVWMLAHLPMEGVAVAGDSLTGREVFQQNCALCHVSGVAAAPRVDIPIEWEPRMSAGRQNLLNSVLRGKGGMPPKGGNASISDEQAAAGLDYLLERVAGLKDETQMAKGQQGGCIFKRTEC